MHRDLGTRTDAGPRLIVATLVAATVSSVYPGFLIGALSVQAGDDLGVSEGTYGWGLGSFFLAGLVSSAPGGRLVQRIGPRNQITMCLTVSAAAQLTLAATADSFTVVVALLVVAGLANGAAQSAANLAITRARLPRLGLAVAVKQSGMPAASMASGLMVPALALTVGWRWAYVVGATAALGAAVAVRAVIAPQPDGGAARVSRLVSPMRTLWLAATVAALLAFAAGALNAWVVASGVDAGLGEGLAGVMLSVGALAGISMRLYGGVRSDSLRMRPFRVAGLTALVGAAGLTFLAVRHPGAHALATVAAFTGAWIWPVFTNYGIVRTNPDAAGAATGITQMGVYLGAFSAPLVTGWIIEASGYPIMWTVVGFTTLAGAALALAIADEF